MSKIRNVTLETVIGVTSAVPEKDRIEVAFAGKSNVGKSSLINTLIQRKSLARTSSQPGKTQTINYYRVNEGTPASDTQLAEPFAPDYFPSSPLRGRARRPADAFSSRDYRADDRLEGNADHELCVNRDEVGLK